MVKLVIFDSKTTIFDGFEMGTMNQLVNKSWDTGTEYGI
jgi:hypothetical protein